MNSEERTHDITAGNSLSTLSTRAIVIAGTAVVLIQIMLGAFVWLAVRNMDEAATQAANFERTSGFLQETLRGINELVLTEGAAAARQTGRDGLAGIKQIGREISLAELARGHKIDLAELENSMSSFLELGRPTASDVDAMMALGKLAGTASELAELLQARSQVADVEAAKARHYAYLLVAFTTGLAVCGIIGGYALFYVRVTRPLQAAIGIALRIADGELDTRIDETRSGEMLSLVRALGVMQSNLRSIVGDTREMARSVVESSKQLASAATDLSSRTEQQASTLEETASSMEEFAASIRQTADHTKQATQSVQKAIGSAEHGRAVVSNTASRMADIHASAKKITEITNIIDSIAFQTNILALNAAVEAARAGEQGRGFAVVAAEVRALAQRSAASAKDIKQLIQATVSSVEAGNALAADADTAMDGIVNSSQSMLQIVSDISTAANEQASNIDNVNRAVVQLEEVTQQNAALVEQSAATADSMRGQAEELSVLVSRFKLDDSQLREDQTRLRRNAALAEGKPAKPSKPSAPRIASAPSSKAPALADGPDGEWEEF